MMQLDFTAKGQTNLAANTENAAIQTSQTMGAETSEVNSTSGGEFEQAMDSANDQGHMASDKSMSQEVSSDETIDLEISLMLSGQETGSEEDLHSDVEQLIDPTNELSDTEVEQQVNTILASRNVSTEDQKVQHAEKSEQISKLDLEVGREQKLASTQQLSQKSGEKVDTTKVVEAEVEQKAQTAVNVTDEQVAEVVEEEVLDSKDWRVRLDMQEKQLKNIGKNSLENQFNIQEANRGQSITGLDAAYGMNTAKPSVKIADTVGTQNWGNALNDRILMFANRNISNAEIQLTPRELGPIDIKIQVSGDKTSIVFNSSVDATRQAIEENSSRLKSSLSEFGFANVDVNISQGDADNEMEQDEGLPEQLAEWEGEGATESMDSQSSSKQALSLVDYYI